MPPVRFLTRNEQKLNETIDQGYRKVETLEARIAPLFRPSSPDSCVDRPEGPARLPEGGRKVA